MASVSLASRESRARFPASFARRLALPALFAAVLAVPAAPAAEPVFDVHVHLREGARSLAD